MRKKILSWFCVLWPLFITAQDAREIVRKADEKARGASSFAELNMKVIRSGWTREMEMKVWTKGHKLAMVLVTAPAREKGIVYLKVNKEVWNWIPSIERNVKLPPSMMSQSWMGTDFSNDDLVKEFSILDDYTHTLAGEEIVEGRKCYKVLLIPKPEAAVVWGQVLLWIDTSDFIMLKAEYFDDENVLINRMLVKKVEMLGGRMLPSVLEMIPVDKVGQKTVITYKRLTFDQPIEDNFFSVRQMQKMQ